LIGLQTVVDLLAQSAERELKPGLARAANKIQDDAAFGGAVPGGQIAAARQMLTHAIARLKDNAAHHLYAAEILAVAIKRALDNFESSDEDAAARLARVEAELAEGVAAARRAASSLPTPNTPEVTS
jgi:hypothetical protein